MKFKAIYGVDFSGARLAGRNTWVARIERGRRGVGCGREWKLVEIERLEDLCGTALRAGALAHLVDLIGGSDGALWSLDFPFGLPVEVLGERWARARVGLRSSRCCARGARTGTASGWSASGVRARSAARCTYGG